MFISWQLIYHIYDYYVKCTYIFWGIKYFLFIYFSHFRKLQDIGNFFLTFKN